MHGVFQDATPFQFHEENKVIDHIGEQLRYLFCFSMLLSWLTMYFSELAATNIMVPNVSIMDLQGNK